MTTSCCAAKKWMMKRNGAACNRKERERCEVSDTLGDVYVEQTKWNNMKINSGILYSVSDDLYRVTHLLGKYLRLT